MLDTSRRDPTSLARPFPTLLLGVLLGLAALTPTAAVETKNFSLGLSGVVGGPFDADGEDPGLGQNGFSGHFAWRTQPRTKVVVRLATIDMSDEVLGNLFDPTLDYVAVGGEYSFQESYYVSGFYAGLGLYRIDGTLVTSPVGASEDDTSLGFTLGATGDFNINERFSIFADLSFHYADLEAAQTFGFLHVGLAYHF